MNTKEEDRRHERTKGKKEPKDNKTAYKQKIKKKKQKSQKQHHTAVQQQWHIPQGKAVNMSRWSFGGATTHNGAVP